MNEFEITFQSTHASTLAIGRRWTNHNVLVETDISKCGIAEDMGADMGRRNTCPNPTAYRPIIHREALAQGRTQPQNSTAAARSPLAVKFSRNARPIYYPASRSPRPILEESNNGTAPKRNSAAQTEISALPEHWRSESNLVTGRFGGGFFTLPSKFVPPPGCGYNKRPMR